MRLVLVKTLVFLEHDGLCKSNEKRTVDKTKIYKFQWQLTKTTCQQGFGIYDSSQISCIIIHKHKLMQICMRWQLQSSGAVVYRLKYFVIVATKNVLQPGTVPSSHLKVEEKLSFWYNFTKWRYLVTAFVMFSNRTCLFVAPATLRSLIKDSQSHALYFFRSLNSKPVEKNRQTNASEKVLTQHTFELNPG